MLRQWKHIIDDDPTVDYVNNTLYGFVHYREDYKKHNKCTDDFDIIYGTYKKSRKPSYRYHLDFEKNNLRYFFQSIFKKYRHYFQNKNNIVHERALVNEMLFQSFLNFSRKAHKILSMKCFPARTRKRIILNIVKIIIASCKNVPHYWKEEVQSMFYVQLKQ